MSKDLYFIGLEIQKPMRCHALDEENPSGRPGMSHYLLELYEPIFRIRPSLYKGGYWAGGQDNVGNVVAKLLFFPTGVSDKNGVVKQPYGETGPFLGTVGCFGDDSKAALDGNYSIVDRAMLCVSEKQAQEFLQNLEALKKKRYYLDFFGTRSAEVIKGLTIDGRKDNWLLKISPPVRGHYFGRVKDIAYLVFYFKDFPRPPNFDALGGGASPFHEDAVIKVIEDSFTEEDYQWAFIKGGHYSDECVLLPFPRPEWPQPDSMEVKHDRAAAYYAQKCRSYLLTKKGSHPPIPIKLQFYLTDK
ncbi:hypothetical protein HY772_07890, partial [Candidatus Woesearchaeota archaeon]|nr:hypothetical protein [Candidatus Woesearchaeota archaeon]